MARRTNTAKWLEGQKRWQINVQKDGKRRTFTCSTPGRTGQRICNKKADDWLEGVTTDPKIRVGKLYTRMVDELRITASVSHIAAFDPFTRQYLEPVLWSKKVATLTEQDYQDVILYAWEHPTKGKPLSKKSLKDIKGCLCAFAKYARKNGISTLRPESLTIPKGAAEPNKQALQPADLRKLFTATKTTYRGVEVDEWYIHAFRFSAATGLRPGELAALRRENVDLKAKTCRVEDSFDVRNNPTKGKNKNAIRSFILPDVAVAEVIAQQKMLKQHGVISPYLFPEPDGGATRHATSYRHWVRFKKHNGLSDISPYELRHTFFSVNKSLPGELVKLVGGHSDAFDTFGHYGHELDGEAAQAARLINDEFTKILSSAEEG